MLTRELIELIFNEDEKQKGKPEVMVFHGTFTIDKTENRPFLT